MTHASDREPFFIVGCSRSGTTLLQALVDGHPDIAIPPESQIYTRFRALFHEYGDLSARRNRRRFIEDLLCDRYIRHWRLDATGDDVEARIRRGGRGGVIEALFSLYAEKDGARAWGDKTPEHIRHLDLIRTDFPRAKLIHLVRDGRDVAEAMRRMIPGPVTPVGLAREWRREVMHWRHFCADHGAAGTLLVHYEELVTSPSATLEKVLGFLGQPYVDTTASYATTPLSRLLGEQSAWHASLRQGISADKVRIYRLKFTPREIEIFESIAGDALDAYGYGRDCTAPRAATRRDRLYARVADPVVRWVRKLLHPATFRDEVQYRIRLARRLVP